MLDWLAPADEVMKTMMHEASMMSRKMTNMIDFLVIRSMGPTS
jgi:hypothetical protein